MGRTSVVIWLLLISVAASDKLLDHSALLGDYLPPTNSFGSKPPKDPFQSLSFDLPIPAPGPLPSASHSSSSQHKTSVDSVEEQYVPPKEVSKETQAEPHLGTCILANPYVQAPSHTQEKHESSKQIHVAPDKSEEEVSQHYEPPQQIYVTPEEAKEVKQTYEPPNQSYIPPDDSEEIKVEQTYQPPEQTYLTPHESEESKVKEKHEPPITLYELPDKSEEVEKPIVPQTLYETPVKSPTSHFQLPQNIQKPPKSEPPKKSFQVPELIQTYSQPNHEKPKPVGKKPDEDDIDSKEGSASFFSQFSPPSKPSQLYDTPTSQEKEDKSSSSLFFKLPEPSYSQPESHKEDSEETHEKHSHKATTPRPSSTYEIPRPSYQVPQPTYETPQTSYFIPNADKDSEEVPEPSIQEIDTQPELSYEPPVESHKGPSVTNFFSIPQQTYKVPEPSPTSLESSDESREHSPVDDTEHSEPSQQYESPQQSYSPPQEDSQEKYEPPEKPKQTYRPPIQSYKPPRVTASKPVESKTKTNFFSTQKLGHQTPSTSSSEVKKTKETSIKYKPILKRPKPAVELDSHEEFSAPKLSSISKPSSLHKEIKPTETHSFFKTPSDTRKPLTGKKSPSSIKTHGYSSPIKDSGETDRERTKPKASGSILFPSHQTTKKPKLDSEEEPEQPSKQPHRAPEQSYKPPSNDEDSQEKYEPPKPSSTNIKSSIQKAKEPALLAETTTMKMMMPYDFKWNVRDTDSGNDFGQTAVSDGMVEKGSYHVLLPDGRKQIVTYLADWDTGYHVDVKYEGEVNPFAQSTQHKSSVAYS